MLNKWLFTKQDNSPIVIFRIFFGLLVTLESWGAIATSWVHQTFDVSYSFPFFGFEWTQILLGIPMYVLYVIMGFFGIGIMLGYKYRIATVGFFLLWTLTYVMQKVNYNNHYYLLVLVSAFMIVIPANRYKSLDVKYNPNLACDFTYSWTTLLFKIQIAIVYFYASVAKFYKGWLDNDFLSIRLNQSADWFQNELGFSSFSMLLRNEIFQYILSYSGIFFDMFIIPLLLYKKTRNIAFFAMLFFHFFNSITLHIGIFPYFAMAFAVFFYPTKTIQKLFFPKKHFVPTQYTNNDTQQQFTIIKVLFITYFLVQIALPIRHWFIKGDVLWTEEGHRMSWRMMLRAKTPLGIKVYIQEANKPKELLDLKNHLTQTQINSMSTKPDMMYQFAKHVQFLKEKEGKKVKIYISSQVAINRGSYQEMIKPNTDFSTVQWKTFGHQNWITEYEPSFK